MTHWSAAGAAWEKVWEFHTARFEVCLEVTPCADDPADSFEFPEDIEAVREERVLWFDARVRVLLDDREIGADYLGCCSYNTIREFYTSHRDPDPMNRNCEAMRAGRGRNAVVCHYFPSMVSEAISEARKGLTDLPRVRVS